MITGVVVVMRKITYVAVAALLVAVAGSGCGDGGQSVATTSEPQGTTTPAPPSTAAPTTTEPAAPAQLVLRADGLGPFEFGSDMSSVSSWLAEVVGPPTVVDISAWPGLPFVSGTMVESCARQQILSWPSAGLTVGFSDLAAPVGVRDCSQPGLRLWAWSLAMPEAGGSRLLTEDGIAPGATVAELRSADAGTVFMALNDSTFYPTGFFLPGGEYGVLTWDWISDLQRALDESGAQLAIDGMVGPATRSAVEDYRSSHGLDSVEAVLEALIEPPDGATVASISSHGWFWEFDCGTLDQWGWEGC